jgi:protein-tyrosine phosphatase
MRSSRARRQAGQTRRRSKFQLIGWVPQTPLSILDEMYRSAGDMGRIDASWVTGRIAVGGGIWNAENMTAVARAEITHVIDMQIEFDDTPLAEAHGIEVLWNPIDDDFQPKPAAIFQRGVEFAVAALDRPATKLLIHCAAGVHRAPMMTLALLGVLGWKVKDGIRLIESRRPSADFADVYVRSVERFLAGYETARK